MQLPKKQPRKKYKQKPTIIQQLNPIDPAGSKTLDQSGKQTKSIDKSRIKLINKIRNLPN